MVNNIIMEKILEKLAKSQFRSKFKLNKECKQYVLDKGLDSIRLHAYDFISKRIAPADIPNDGKQTPYKNHPVFIAQHATATCCRGCISKWHGIPKSIELSEKQKEYIVDFIMFWIERQIAE